MKQVEGVNIFSQEELSGVTPINLPPAGAARDEVLARREDELQEKAETIGAGNVGTIPSKFLDPENEREINDSVEKGYLDIGTGNPLYKTCWVNYSNLNGQKVWEKKAQGWKVATANEFPEARHLVMADNTIRVGDVLLMYLRIDMYVQLEQREAEKRRKQQFGLDSEVTDLAARNPGIFKNVHSGDISELPADLSATIESRSQAQSAARKVAAQHLGNRMKQGEIPGVPIK